MVSNKIMKIYSLSGLIKTNVHSLCSCIDVTKRETVSHNYKEGEVKRNSVSSARVMIETM